MVVAAAVTPVAVTLSNHLIICNYLEPYEYNSELIYEEITYDQEKIHENQTTETGNDY